MKHFAYQLCLLLVGTSSASHLLRGSNDIHEDGKLFQVERRALYEENAETQVHTTDMDEFAMLHLEDETSDAHNTAQVYQACRELHGQGPKNSLVPSDGLRQFCDKMGPFAGSLCFEDSHCGGLECSTLAEGPKESIAVWRWVPSFVWTWRGQDYTFYRRQKTTYSNVFICYDATDRSDSINIGRKPRCLQGCEACNTEFYKCNEDTDCEIGSTCERNSDLNFKFCVGSDRLVPEGGCCTDGGKCADKFCDTNPPYGGVMIPVSSPGVSRYPTSTGVCRKRP